MPNLNKLLAELTAMYPDNYIRGKAFEYVFKWFLQTDPYYRDVFLYVWIWDEWPDREKFGFGIDIGIDLVAQTYEGERWAIQAKFYKDTHPTNDIDSFLAVSGSKYFPYRMLVTTSALSKNGLKKIESQEKPVYMVTFKDLDKRPLDWLNYLGKGNQVGPTETKGLFGRLYRSWMGDAYGKDPGEIWADSNKKFKEGMREAWDEFPLIGGKGMITNAISGAKDAFRQGEQKALANMEQQARQDQRRANGNNIRHLTEPLPDNVSPTTATERYMAILTHMDIYIEVLEPYAQNELAKASIELARQGADCGRIDELYRQNPAQFRNLSFTAPILNPEATDSNIDKLIQRAKKDGLIAYLVESDPYTYDDESHAESTLRSLPEPKLRSVLKKAHNELDKAPKSTSKSDNEDPSIVEQEPSGSNLSPEYPNETRTTDHCEEEPNPENITSPEVSEIYKTPTHKQNFPLVSAFFQESTSGPEMEMPQDFINYFRSQLGVKGVELVNFFNWKPLIDNDTWKQMIQDWKLGIEKKAENGGDISSDFILVKLNQDTEEAPLKEGARFKSVWKINGMVADANMQWQTKFKNKLDPAIKKWKKDDKLDENSKKESTEVYRMVMAHVVRYEGLIQEKNQYRLLEIAELAIRRGAEVDPSKQVSHVLNTETTLEEPPPKELVTVDFLSHFTEKWKGQGNLDENAGKEATQVYKELIKHAFRHEDPDTLSSKVIELVELAMSRGAKVDLNKHKCNVDALTKALGVPQDFINYFSKNSHHRKHAFNNWKPLIDNDTWKQMIQDWKIGIEDKTKNGGDISSDFILIKLNQDTEEAPLVRHSKGMPYMSDFKYAANSRFRRKLDETIKKWKEDDKLDENSKKESTEVYRMVMSHVVGYEGLIEEKNQYRLLEIAELAIRRGAEVDPSKQGMPT